MANIALHGLETDTKEAMLPLLKAHWKKTKDYPSSRKVLLSNMSIIRYADDFVVLHEDKHIVERSKEYIEHWLQNIGLELKDSKTRICHTSDGDKPGFDFLGFNVRQQNVSLHNCGKSRIGFKTLIKPSSNSLKKHLKVIKESLRKLRGANQAAVISKLNPIIRGWSQYFCTAISRKVFAKAAHQTHQKLWQWAKFRHAHKGLTWIKSKYFKRHGNDNWRFMDSDGYFLYRHSDLKIKNHVKVRGDKSPYDGDYLYWSQRMGKHPMVRNKVAMLLKIQKGKCSQCLNYFMPGEVLEVHHADKNHDNNDKTNLRLIHGHCHDNAHRSRGLHDKHQAIEEPCDLKGTRTVLKPSLRGDSQA